MRLFRRKSEVADCPPPLVNDSSRNQYQTVTAVPALILEDEHPKEIKRSK
jgi:hypothetical protein